MSRITRTNRPPAQIIRSFVFRKRRLIAAALLCAAAGITVQALLPDDQSTQSVIVASADLPAGAVLDPSQLTTADLPADAVPKHAFRDVEGLIGQQLATPLYQGDVVAENFLVGAGLLAGAPEGTVAVPLRPADESIVQLLSPGLLVDVVLSTGNGYEVSAKNSVLARGLPVLWTASDAGAGPWPDTGAQEGLVVVAANPADAAALAGASSTGQVHLVLTGKG